jgi:hypothetical protein
MMWHRLFLFFRFFFSSLFFVAVVAPEWPAFQDETYRLRTIVGLRQFDFVVWEANALLIKGHASVTGSHTYLDEERRKEVVLHFLDLVREARRLERDIAHIYIDPAVADPEAASAGLQRQVDELRAEMRRLQPIAEAIIEEQVASVLIDEGFAVAGRAWPPVKMNMTPLPYVLLVSPREEIRRLYGIPLVHGLPVAEHEALESAILEYTDRSALVVSIGGLGIYPAMILESHDINYLADVVAHEWSHHWLTLKPLGIRYAENPTMHTINETVANIFGKEVGAIVVERYYPELAPPPPAPPPPPSPDPADPAAPPPFNFRVEMAETRIVVDELLAEGRIEEAEAYMEERRHFFVTNGFRIRKINQAYFAFYGAYADVPGATGADPIGPAVVGIRERSETLRVFMDQLAPITSLEDLHQVAAEMGIELEN